MKASWYGLVPAALTALVLSSSGCRTPDSMTHLIPDGYVGSVVILFDDPKGGEPDYDKQGGVIYEIPPGGVLRLSTPAPEAGFHNVRYFYLRRDGTREEIPKGIPRVADEEMLQVFAVVDGATGGERDERPPDRWTWEAYVVGVPAERDDWVRLRDQATRRAISKPGLM